MFNQGRPTDYHIQTNTLSAIDLCFCSVGELRDFQLEVDEDLHGSDHFPIYLTGAEYIPQHQVPRWIIGKANWDQFTEITEQIAGIPDSEPLEFYGQIIGKITEGTTKSIPKSDGYYKVAPVPWWNANCANLKKERLKAQKQANRRPTVSNVQRSKGCKKIPRTLLGRSMYPHSTAIPRMLKSGKKWIRSKANTNLNLHLP